MQAGQQHLAAMITPTCKAAMLRSVKTGPEWKSPRNNLLLENVCLSDQPPAGCHRRSRLTQKYEPWEVFQLSLISAMWSDGQEHEGAAEYYAQLFSTHWLVLQRAEFCVKLISRQCLVAMKFKNSECNGTWKPAAIHNACSPGKHPSVPVNRWLHWLSTQRWCWQHVKTGQCLWRAWRRTGSDRLAAAPLQPPHRSGHRTDEFLLPEDRGMQVTDCCSASDNAARHIVLEDRLPSCFMFRRMDTSIPAARDTPCAHLVSLLASLCKLWHAS